MSQKSSNIAAEKIANGEAQEWKKLVKRYNKVLVSQAYSITHDTQSANDMAQMVLLKLWEQRSIAVHIKSLEAYLVQAARNTALTYIQQRDREVPYLSDITMLTSGRKANRPETVAQQKEFREMISIQIARLTPRQHEVIEHILSEPTISTRKLGKVLGCSHKNVQAILGRIRHQFRNIQKLLKE
ncbi:MAG: RNA polymerase sigma factor [Planctomycetota bacterium]